MARSSKQTDTKQDKGGRKAASPAAKSAQKKGSAAKAAAAAPAPLLDDRTKRDIGGVSCAILAIALFIVTAMPADALVTAWLSQSLHLMMGVGAYILPFVLLLVGASLFVKSDGARVPLRVSIGLALIFFALLVLLALYTPGVEDGVLGPLFTDLNLISQGGYIGAGVAWLLMLLLGRLVSTVLMAGVIIVALIIIGFSISRFIEIIREKRDAKRALEEEFGDLEAMQQRAKRPDAAIKRAGARQPKLPNLSEDDVETHKMNSSRKLRRATSSIAGATFQPVTDEAVAATSKAMTRKLGKKPAAADSSESATRALSSKNKEAAATPKPSDGFQLPDRNLLKKTPASGRSAERESRLKEKGMLLQETLSDFGVYAEVVGWVAGPTVTLFKVDLPAGVRVSRVTNLTDDIALALASPGVRIFAPIPGTNYVGIEVPNDVRQTVLLGDILGSAGKKPLEIAIGKDVEGRNIISDLAKMPHLLIGGTTGSGKSVSINGMIMSILMRATPAEVRFIMIDPKRVEFTPYNGIPHLYVPVVTECREAASALSWAVAEMERRLKVFSKVGARNISQYNAKVQQGMKIGEDDAVELPYIVIIIDELADLMMNVGKEVEFSISRLAQLARAAGIHMIVATQRPSTNVVTGLIKANITNRIALNVATGIDSRVILDETGAENLIGNGDLLLSKPELPKPQRIQGCYVSEEEIAAVVDELKAQGEPEYHSEILQTNIISLGDSMPDGSGGSSTADDPLIWDAAEIVVNSGLGSTSNLQRRLKVGYSRAGRIMDMLEEKGVVGPPNGSKPREVLVDTMELETLKAFESNDEATDGEV